MKKMRALCLAFAVCVCVSANSFAAEPPQGFRDQVKTAIEKGVEWLKNAQLDDGTFGVTTGQAYGGMVGQVHDNKIGITAFSLYTLLKCGVPKNDPVIVKGFTWLIDNYDKLNRSTYEIAACLFAMEMFCAERPPRPDGMPEWEWKQLPLIYTVGRREAAMITHFLEDILANQQDAPGGGKGWRYGAPGSYFHPQDPNVDLSATQYALLGLGAINRMQIRGLQVGPDPFVGALQFVLNLQKNDGEPVRRTDQEFDPHTTYVASDGDKARGWCYAFIDEESLAPFPPQNPNPQSIGMNMEKWQEAAVTGSMTTAGVCSLLLCKNELSENRRLWTRNVSEMTEKGIKDGFGWIINNYTMESNPAILNGEPMEIRMGMAVQRLGGQHYYFLYGMERMCVFGGFDNLGEHNWYTDGAQVLLNQQKPSGANMTHWNSGQTHEPQDILDTCFALLFLEKATIPLPRSSVITEGPNRRR
ncbi:MAG: hypothetical protein NUW37_07120 [Planctomycetes bacterium]|nr:hypothetical protein [Planctomycetota bacterium]